MAQRNPPDDPRRPRLITRARLAELLDAYGAEPARWPAAERAAALALLAHSPARRQRDAAARLDALLDRGASGSVPLASPALLERVVAAAQAAPTAPDSGPAAPRLQSEVRARHPGRTRDAARRSGSRPAAPRRMPSWRLLAAAVPLAAAAALGLWLVRSGGSDPAMVVRAPAPPVAASPAASSDGTDAPLAGRMLAEFERYDVPTDDLLEVDDLEIVDLPALGCTEDDWGCPDLDAGDAQSTTDTTRRILA